MFFKTRSPHLQKFVRILSGGGSPEHLSVDIKACVADDKTLFVDAVLFFDDTEVYCLEPIYDLLGEYIFEYDNVQYIIIVKKKG